MQLQVFVVSVCSILAYLLIILQKDLAPSPTFIFPHFSSVTLTLISLSSILRRIIVQVCVTQVVRRNICLNSFLSRLWARTLFSVFFFKRSIVLFNWAETTPHTYLLFATKNKNKLRLKNNAIVALIFNHQIQKVS